MRTKIQEGAGVMNELCGMKYSRSTGALSFGWERQIAANRREAKY